MIGQGIFGLIFTAIAIGMTLVFGAVGGPVAIFPMFFVVIGVVMAFTGFRKSATFSAAPLQRFRAGIVDERIKVSGGGENSRAKTQYYATLQNQDGERREYLVNEDIAAVIAPGDVGVAFVKASYLLDFSRVDV